MSGFDLVTEGLDVAGTLLGLTRYKEAGEKLSAAGSVLGFIFKLLGFADNTPPEAPPYPTVDEIAAATAALTVKILDQEENSKRWQRIETIFGEIEHIYGKGGNVTPDDDGRLLVLLQALIGQDYQGELTQSVDDVAGLIEAPPAPDAANHVYPTNYGYIPLFFHWANLELYYVSLWYRMLKTKADQLQTEEAKKAAADIGDIALNLYQRRIGTTKFNPPPSTPSAYATGLTFYIDAAGEIMQQRRQFVSALTYTEQGHSERPAAIGRLPHAYTTGSWVATDDELHQYRGSDAGNRTVVQVDYSTSVVNSVYPPDATTERNAAYPQAQQDYGNYTAAMNAAMCTDLGMGPFPELTNQKGMQAGLQQWITSLQALEGSRATLPM